MMPFAEDEVRQAVSVTVTYAHARRGFTFLSKQQNAIERTQDRARRPLRLSQRYNCQQHPA